MKELFDVLDKNRNKLGYTKERGEKLLSNEYNMAVENFIICDNKLLMTKRSKNKSHPNMWEVPGGCSQKGEESIDTLKREMKEEIDFDINNTDTKYIDTKLYKNQFIDIYQTKTNINLNNIKLQKEEVSDVKLFNKQEFNNLITNNEIVPSVLERWNGVKDKIDLDW